MPCPTLLPSASSDLRNLARLILQPSHLNTDMVNLPCQLKEHSLGLINDVYFDSTISRVRRQRQAFQRLLQRKDMRHQLLHIDDAPTHARDTRRPGICVTIDEAEINLSEKDVSYTTTTL